jgi:UDP-N-acetylglucosamine--N-acetylmuramyl-(pentapeptide) pyrophosphoryl-undecaprenol N-acetylglucosamine transferase
MSVLKQRQGRLNAGAEAGPACTRRIAIVAGGTAGHVYPALAVADAYRAALPGSEVLFLGNSAGFEAELVGRTRYRFRSISSSALMRENLWGKARAIRNLLSSYVEARRILKAGGFQMVLGFGSYTCGGAIPAARSLGLKTAIHESNTRAGLANRFLGAIVDRAYIGFESAERDFPSERTCLTGNPVRADVLALFDEERQAPAGERPVRILVTGGSLGSPFLNRRTPEMIECLAASGLRVEVRHQSGHRSGDDVRALYRRALVEGSVSEYIEDMPEAYRWADFAITSAGAATMAELAVAGLPTLFVPLRAAARNHQLGNAIAFTNQGGGWYVEEHAWQPKTVARGIAALLNDGNAWCAASSAMRRLARPFAAELIVAECEKLAAGSGKIASNGGAALEATPLAGR